jgi:hypothetical protein
MWQLLVLPLVWQKNVGNRNLESKVSGTLFEVTRHFASSQGWCFVLLASFFVNYKVTVRWIA